MSTKTETYKTKQNVMNKNHLCALLLTPICILRSTF